MRFCRVVARVAGRKRAERRVAGFLAGVCLSAFPVFIVVASLGAQEVGSLDRESFGAGSVITVKLHAGSPGESPTSVMVQLLHGTIPIGHRETSSGAAEFVVGQLGEYTVIVSAHGYLEEQKDVSVVNGRTQVDVYLRPAIPANGVAGAPGQAMLTPKAKQALDQGIRALKQNRVPEAEKYLGAALRLAPANPDVLYMQGLLCLKQRNWQQAKAVLEKAAQLDPKSARTVAALGMAQCDAGEYDAAIPSLEKSLQLDAANTWQTRCALAKSYYHAQRFAEALKLSQEALAQSRGEAPEIALLVAQSQTAEGRYEEAAATLRDFVRDYPDRAEATTARRWLDQLAANGKVRPASEQRAAARNP
jgi:Flp pilus assembly protein TadD